MENLFLAKSNPRESIVEHTEKLIEAYETLKKIYPDIKNMNWDLLKLACIYHDLGKMNTKFQNKIVKNINKDFEKNGYSERLPLLEDEFEEVEEIPHGYLSNAFIPFDYLEENFTEEEIRILYESIFYHHNREHLQGDRKKELNLIIKNDLNKYLNQFIYGRLVCSTNKINLNNRFMKFLKSRVLDDYSILNHEEYKIASKFIMTKGLLNKIDYAASSNVKIEISPGNLEELTKKSLEPYKINELQQYMKENSQENLIIKASTGIGKTEGALMWIGNNKGFFTLPLRVSINSIYDRVASKIKYGKDRTGLLHSNSASEYMKRNEKGTIDKKYLDTTKQLSLPLTICTLDQLIGFIFKYEGFELKLATLSYSKVIIDEIQMYSSEMIAYLIIALRDIVKVGGKFAIVTATFPPIFEHFMNYAGIVKNVDYKIPTKAFLKKNNGQVMLRHKVKVWEDDIDAKFIYENYKNKKVLVIVNTVKAAQKLYENLEKYDDIKNDIFMFHSRYTQEDRAKKEITIFENGQLKNKFSGIWITTQVVEASLDIDFDVLYTELSDISGLLQRMGRVYRNRILDTDKVNINVFVGGNKLPSGIHDNMSNYESIIDIDIFNKSKEAILKYDGLKLDEEEKMLLVEDVYSVKNLKESKYFSNIKDTINIYNDLIPYDLKKNEAKLRNISSETVIPEDVYKNNKEEIKKILDDINETNAYDEKIRLKDELMKKTVTISSSMFDSIEKNGGKLEEIEISKYQTIYIVCGNYSFEKGYEVYKKEKSFSENQFL
ncbi:CRISPR-associated helicase/endonuclease Cas3 [Clostridium botulinum]|uniref:CRISPR-associated helicase/endonuclease Cas3 n=1 Tax=Clostridium botulinum TaxID=1491 RepID=A0A6B4JRH4_CLOBO|nr:CRISPR-associated helicase/endonuclease Cas3 [Clostridium botulinum]EES50580.1 metal dependent phosphohydrolase [Clostridium botulinum E1 str. 'BoNT E Beluga']MBY6762918.1 CRISPR-associated helicase/endonuclease Cas3 [Clostridium botulinum]MBY6921747.1 CRISPR-associated helicase/endonuclease Cas3 [Clostridium botulinum]MCR1131582.1 CRISPR-associated helicase/endonuclease Cas3 [Clostridium botulinum]NFJ59612.1 CRISPR-associated helicase/endonuclease Cas3 [Clostridium botulinum]